MQTNLTITTFTGRHIDPLNPDPDQIVIEDIAHALSNLCRFTGHVHQFLSVAEHSVNVSKLVPENLALVGLLHDASEAYLADISSPIKRRPEFAFYREIEKNLMDTILRKFVGSTEIPLLVHHADKEQFGTEWWLFMNDENRANAILPSQAKVMFMKRYSEIVCV